MGMELKSVASSVSPQLLSKLPKLALSGSTAGLLFLIAVLAPSVLAQVSSETVQSEEPQFTASVDQVVLYASVYNQNGFLVSGLSKEDFEVYEDKRKQEITSFAQAEVPSTLGIVLDSSGSMRAKWPLVEDAVDLFLSLNNPQNQLFFIRFDDEVHLEESFTYDVEDIRDSVYNVIVKGGTALYDAIFLGVEKTQQGEEPKKVLVVFTDGEDKDSYYRHEELLEKVRESETQVFIVAFLDDELSDSGGFFGIFDSEREKIEKKITQIADYTGGKAFFPEKIGELSTVFEAIAKELKRQYRIAYVSDNNLRNGEWRSIDVRLDNARERGLRVRARKGYYATAN